MTGRGAIVALALMAWSRLAGATEGQGVELDERSSPPSLTRTQAAGAIGAFLPFSQVASLESQRAWAVGFGGYDSARHTGTFEASAEMRLWGPISVRGGAVYTNGDHTMRPSLGARIQALRESRHGVAGAVGVFYRPEGLTEPEGEIESVASVGRHLGATYLLANAVYGQDPEGNERDGELRLGATRPIGSRFSFGFDGRLRFDLGSSAAKLAQHREPTADALVGPSATVFVGPAAVSLAGGGSAFRAQQVTAFGLFAMVGIGVAL